MKFFAVIALAFAGLAAAAPQPAADPLEVGN